MVRVRRGMVIDHLNGNILDWSADNLEYVTPKENRKRTAVMNGYVKTFVELYPDKKPDEIKLTVKVIE